MEHENNHRHDLLTTVRRLRTDRDRDRSDFALAKLENERERRVLCEELAAARRETALLKDQHESLLRDLKNMFGILQHAGCLYSRKRPRTVSTGGDTQHKLSYACAS